MFWSEWSSTTWNSWPVPPVGDALTLDKNLIEPRWWSRINISGFYNGWKLYTGALKWGWKSAVLSVCGTSTKAAVWNEVAAGRELMFYCLKLKQTERWLVQAVWSCQRINGASFRPIQPCSKAQLLLQFILHFTSELVTSVSIAALRQDSARLCKFCRGDVEEGGSGDKGQQRQILLQLVQPWNGDDAVSVEQPVAEQDDQTLLLGKQVLKRLLGWGEHTETQTDELQRNKNITFRHPESCSKHLLTQVLVW